MKREAEGGSKDREEAFEVGVEESCRRAAKNGSGFAGKRRSQARRSRLTRQCETSAKTPAQQRKVGLGELESPILGVHFDEELQQVVEGVAATRVHRWKHRL